VKAILTAPLLLVAIGVLILFGGSTAANAEETAANAIGRILQSKWLAIGLIAAGALLFANEQGYLER
jgi:hypothetical protein